MTGYTARQRKLAQGIVNTVQAIIERGGTAPSREVQVKSATIAGHPWRIVQHVSPARAYTVKGDTGEHLVVVWHELGDPEGPVVQARCSCRAGDHETTCSHLLAVLAHLDADGTPLQT